MFRVGLVLRGLRALILFRFCLILSCFGAVLLGLCPLLVGVRFVLSGFGALLLLGTRLVLCCLRAILLGFRPVLIGFGLILRRFGFLFLFLGLLRCLLGLGEPKTIFTRPYLSECGRSAGSEHQDGEGAGCNHCVTS